MAPTGQVLSFEKLREQLLLLDICESTDNVLSNNPNKTKFDKKSNKVILVVCSSKEYRLYQHSTAKVIISRNVVINKVVP